jgi:SAM-dependent methyltransferase
MKFACRSCRNTNLLSILSLGDMPLANALLTYEQLSQTEEAFPLDLVFCPQCALVQITETVSPEKLFREYLYFSSFSDTVLENAHEIAQRISVRCGLNQDSLVVEVASNDGYLLKNYQEKGIPVLGIEPALNIARVAVERGIPTVNEFFGIELAEQLRGQGKAADVVHANNVVAHIANLHSMVAGMAALLKPDGVAVVENHYAKDMIDHTEFDAIYHEHVCYYSATSFRNLFSQHDLIMVDVEHLPVHGGSLRAYFQHGDGPRSLEKEGRARVERLMNDEAIYCLDQFAYYQEFAAKVERLRQNLLKLLREIKAQGKHIAVYGASAKSTTLLNYYGIGSETLEFVVDRSTVKQGLYTPGTHLPILHPKALLEHQPDYVLLLTWNFAEEILTQQLEYRKRGGHFIVPIPELRVV